MIPTVNPVISCMGGGGFVLRTPDRIAARWNHDDETLVVVVFVLYMCSKDMCLYMRVFMISPTCILPTGSHEMAGQF